MTEHARVLVVDDDAAARELLTALLDREGYAAAAAPCAAALAAVIRSPPDLIVVDPGVSLADAGGLAAAYLEVPDPHAPVLLIGAGSETAVRATARAMGAAGYLAYPFEPEALLAAAARLTRAAPLPAADDHDEVGSLRYLHRLAQEVATVRAAFARADAATRAPRAAGRSPVLSLWDVARRHAFLREREQLRLQLEHYAREYTARRARRLRG
jgi:DNA-binding response OmpR family regulator